MWKPWIFVTVGLVALTSHVAANTHQSNTLQSSNLLAQQEVEVADFYDYEEVEAANEEEIEMVADELEEEEEVEDEEEEVEDEEEEVEDEEEEEVEAGPATEAQQRNWLERAVIESFNNLKGQFEGKTQTEVVKRIKKLGFDNFVQDAEIKFIKNLDGARFPQYTKDLLTALNVDAANKQKIQEFLEFAPFTEVGNWNMMRSMYSAKKKSDAQYVCLMTYRDEQNRMSVYQVNMKNKFKVAPDILILRSSKSSFGGLFSSSSEKVVKVPHAMTPQDLQQLLDYFDLIAMKRFMRLFGKAAALDVEEEEEVQGLDEELDQVFASLDEYKVKDEEETPQVQFLSALSQGLDVVNKAWDTAKNIFSSEKRNVIVDKIIKLSFNKLKTATQIQMYKSVPQDQFQRVKNVINMGVQIPTNKAALVNEWWQLASFLDASTWNFQNLAFTKDSKGNAKYVNLMYNRDAQGRYTFLVSDTKATFKVAKDMFIWEKYESKMGGMTKNTQQRIEYRPHKITVEEAQILLNLFDNIALEKYSNYLKAAIASQQMLVADQEEAQLAEEISYDYLD